jgi:hypothetical protein
MIDDNGSTLDVCKAIGALVTNLHMLSLENKECVFYQNIQITKQKGRWSMRKSIAVCTFVCCLIGFFALQNATVAE